jgi:4'-phosphopantetheinyl transferase
VRAGSVTWPAAPWSPAETDGEVCVWLANLNPGGDVTRRAATVLSEDERERAARFHFDRDAARWTVARGVLRGILGGCLGVDPQAVRFIYDRFGKPELAPPFAASNLRFNLSHSEGLALYAVTEGRRVGVDIEHVRSLRDLEAVADRTFSIRERAALRQLPPHLRHTGFFNCWTRKEAYIKAVGDGLAHPLDGFSVSLAPDTPARLEVGKDDPGAVSAWTLEALAPHPDYVSAIAFEGSRGRIFCTRWEEYP